MDWLNTHFLFSSLIWQSIGQNEQYVSEWMRSCKQKNQHISSLFSLVMATAVLTSINNIFVRVTSDDHEWAWRPGDNYYPVSILFNTTNIYILAKMQPTKNVWIILRLGHRLSYRLFAMWYAFVENCISLYGDLEGMKKKRVFFSVCSKEEEEEPEWSFVPFQHAFYV